MSSKIPPDNPIKTADADALGRSAAALSFAKSVLSLDPSEGLVVGVLGPWGSGKTSFVNMARAEFTRNGIEVIDFNPWMFSGAEQLVEKFLFELAAQLKVSPRFSKLAPRLQSYGEALSPFGSVPVVGDWVGGLADALKLIGKKLTPEGGVAKQRKDLEEALRQLDKPLLVVLDDIDRLSSREIRDVFRMVRLTASFPNIVYVVAFDRIRVEKALADDGIPGRDYLEKILQIAIDLPAIQPQVLKRQITVALDAALESIPNPGPFDTNVWPDIFMELIFPLIRNMRDVRRFSASAQTSVVALDGQVALADVLALEAVRTFLPDVFGQLHSSVDVLTTPGEPMSFMSGSDEKSKTAVEKLIGSGEPHSEIVRAVVRRLFPLTASHIGGSHYGPEWARAWLKERRVGHRDILTFYLERIAGEGLRAFSDAERAWEKMTDRQAFDHYLRSLDPSRVADVISALEVFEDQITPDQVVSGVVVLLNLRAELPERPKGMFAISDRMSITRVTYRLLRSMGDPVSVEAAVNEILSQLNTLSSKLEVIATVGHREGVGHKLVSSASAAELERRWRADVRSAALSDLERESELFRVLLLTKREAEVSEEALTVPDSPKLTLAILRDARSEIKSQGFGTRTVHRQPTLAWDALVELLGGVSELESRVKTLEASSLEVEADLLALFRKYASGWRPTH